MQRLFAVLIAVGIGVLIAAQDANAYYHAQLGRFVNRDPIEYQGGAANLYEYVNANPVANTDPLGLETDGERPGSRPAPPVPPADSPDWMRPPTVYPPFVPDDSDEFGIPPYVGIITVPPDWTQDIDWGEDVPVDEYPGPNETDDRSDLACYCANINSTKVKPPGGPVYAGKPDGGAFIDVEFDCREGDVRVKKYSAQCRGEGDCCGSCSQYIKWKCEKRKRRPRIGTRWVKADTALTRCQ